MLSPFEFVTSTNLVPAIMIERIDRCEKKKIIIAPKAKKILYESPQVLT